MIPPVNNTTAELQVVSAFDPVEGVVVRPVVPVPDATAGVLCVHVHRAHAPKMGVGELKPCRNAGEGVGYALPLPSPVVEHVAQVKLVDQARRESGVQAKYSITWIDWITGSGMRDAKLVTREQSSDVNLVGARCHFTGISIREKEPPLFTKIVINTDRRIVVLYWETQGGAEPLDVQGVRTVHTRVTQIVGSRQECVPHL